MKICSISGKKNIKRKINFRTKNYIEKYNTRKNFKKYQLLLTADLIVQEKGLVNLKIVKKKLIQREKQIWKKSQIVNSL